MKLFYFVGIGLGVCTVSAQSLIISNPADMGDARANLVNPAVVSWQDPLFSLGTKLLHFGVVENSFSFQNSYFSLTAVDRKIGAVEGFGFGVQGQILNTPMMNNISISGLISKKFFETVSIGASIGFINRSYDRSQFDLDDFDDPLLSQELSKWMPFNLGAGLLVTPTRNLTLGLSINQLNQPDIALGETAAQLPRTVSAGAAVGMSYFRAMVGVTVENDDFLPLMAFESFLPELGFLKIGYGSEAATFEGQLHVGRGVSLSYRYNYPVTDLNLASSGSHELGLVFNFRRRASLYNPVWLEPEIIRRPAINPATAFVVESVFDTLLVVDKYIKRIIDSTITKKELADLPEELFFSTDSLEPNISKIGAGKLLTSFTASDARLQNLAVPSDSASIVEAMQKDYTENYLEFLRNLATRMQDPSFRARIVIPPDGRRAHLLLKYLELYGPVTDRLEMAVQDPAYQIERGKLGARMIPASVFHQTLQVAADTFKFYLNLDDLRWGPVAWTFVLEDPDGNLLLDFSGEKQVLRRYVWNWRLNNGNLPEPGTYYYYIRWKSEDGQLYSSPKKSLTVTRIHRRIAIEIAKRHNFYSNPISKAMVILN